MNNHKHSNKGERGGYYKKKSFHSPRVKLKWVIKNPNPVLTRFPLLDLPSELVFLVVSFLGPTELCSVAQACTNLQDLSNICWKTLCEREYQFVASPHSHHVKWKSYYFYRKNIFKRNAFSWECPEIHGEIPTPRMAHTGVSVGNMVVYIGGQLEDYVRYNDIFFFDTETYTFTKPKIKGEPPKFARHVAVAVDRKIYVFGGFNGYGKYYTLAVLDVDDLTWTHPETKGKSPIPRTNHAAAVVGKKMYIYGGNYTPIGSLEEEYTVLSDLYELDTEELVWREVETLGPHPGPRTAHTLVGIGPMLYLFGGGIWQPKPDRWLKKFNDIYCLDTTTWRWTQLKTGGEIPVCSFPISFVLRHWIFFFGGQKMSEHFITNKLYVFDSVTLTCTEFSEQTSGILPKPRDLGTASFVGRNAFIFAGSSGSPVNDLDVLSWNYRRGLPSNNAEA